MPTDKYMLLNTLECKMLVKNEEKFAIIYEQFYYN